MYEEGMAVESEEMTRVSGDASVALRHATRSGTPDPASGPASIEHHHVTKTLRGGYGGTGDHRAGTGEGQRR